MAPDKVTVMILNVDLKCSCCYKKVKKVLCKFPQIRDQVFDEDKNKVRITVVCCNPEKVRDKLCCKGGKAIKSIEILEDKPKGSKPPNKQPPPPPVEVLTPVLGPKPPNKQPPPPPVEVPTPVLGPKPFCPPAYPVPVSACCQECSEGRSGGPCYDFGYYYGRPVPPPPGPCYGYQFARNRPCYVTRCDYFSEENPQGCSIM